MLHTRVLNTPVDYAMTLQLIAPALGSHTFPLACVSDHIASYLTSHTLPGHPEFYPIKGDVFTEGVASMRNRSHLTFNGELLLSWP